MLNDIRVVLVETSHPGNIGAAARAMKTMGLSRLVLVSPKIFPDKKAVEMAAGADDILDKAIVVDSFDEAIAECKLVIGTSARLREIPLRYVNPREGAELALQHEGQEIALVFGREKWGLTNDELLKCHYHAVIPANPEYSSLNLAAAVQVLSYECKMAIETRLPEMDVMHDDFATSADVERFHQHLEETLIQVGFLHPKTPKRIMPRLRRLFGRVRLEEMEVNLLRGILTAINQKTTS